jgi:superfamily I DNA/RNA helicase
MNTRRYSCIVGQTIPYTTAIIKQYSEIISRIDNIKTAICKDRQAIVDIFAQDIPDNSVFRGILLDAIKDSEIIEEKDMEEWLQKAFAYIVERVSHPDNTAEHDHVRVMSLHASKGLSAKYVVIMSTIDGLIPRIDKQSEVSIDAQIEEQRRLFYVAITRCRGNDSKYPGKLLISSFVGLPGAEALGMKIPANPYAWCSVSASPFIKDFEETAPATIKL